MKITDEIIDALIGMCNEYKALVDSGDCGSFEAVDNQQYKRAIQLLKKVRPMNRLAKLLNEEDKWLATMTTKELADAYEEVQQELLQTETNDNSDKQ